MKEKDLEEISGIFKALGHPVRLRIVEGLIRHPCNVSRIVEGLGLPQSTVSQHLGILRNRGIIAAKKDGVKTCYLVADERIRKLIDCMGK